MSADVVQRHHSPGSGVLLLELASPLAEVCSPFLLLHEWVLREGTAWVAPVVGEEPSTAGQTRRLEIGSERWRLTPTPGTDTLEDRIGAGIFVEGRLVGVVVEVKDGELVVIPSGRFMRERWFLEPLLTGVIEALKEASTLQAQSILTHLPTEEGVCTLLATALKLEESQESPASIAAALLSAPTTGAIDALKTTYSRYHPPHREPLCKILELVLAASPDWRVEVAAGRRRREVGRHVHSLNLAQRLTAGILLSLIEEQEMAFLRDPEQQSPLEDAPFELPMALAASIGTPEKLRELIAQNEPDRSGEVVTSIRQRVLTRLRGMEGLSSLSSPTTLELNFGLEVLADPDQGEERRVRFFIFEDKAAGSRADADRIWGLVQEALHGTPHRPLLTNLRLVRLTGQGSREEVRQVLAIGKFIGSRQ